MICLPACVSRTYLKAQTQTLKHRNTSGRFACAHSRQSDGPDLHVSGIGAVSVPLAQSVHDQLRQICQQKDLPQQGPAGQSDHKLWQLNLSLLAANNPGKSLKFSWFEGFAEPCKCYSQGFVLTDWEGTVCSLAQHLSQELGLLSTASVEAVLQQVTLYDKPDSFNFSLEADTPPNAFATMIVLLLPPHAVCVCCDARLKTRRLGIRRFMSLACHGPVAWIVSKPSVAVQTWNLLLQKVQATVHQGSQRLAVSNHPRCSITLATYRLVCIACFKGTLHKI